MRPSTYRPAAVARIACLALASLTLTACGGDSSTASQTPAELYKSAAVALRDGNYADAVKHSQTALAGMGDEASSDLRAKLQVTQAQARANLDPSAARIAFQDFAAEYPELVGAEDFLKVANTMMDAKSEAGLMEAAQLVHMAKGVYPDSNAIFAGTDALIQERIAAGELGADATEVLKGLGYVQ